MIYPKELKEKYTRFSISKLQLFQEIREDNVDPSTWYELYSLLFQ